MAGLKANAGVELTESYMLYSAVAFQDGVSGTVLAQTIVQPGGYAGSLL